MTVKFTGFWMISDIFNIFWIHHFLNFRQGCAIESAAMRSGLNVMVVMTFPKLHLDDNTTCQLYMSNYKNIQFYTVDVERLAIGSPLGSFWIVFYHILTLVNNIESFFKRDEFKNFGKENNIVHFSDALRVLLVYKFGGFYIDTDYVVINDLSHYQNITVKKDGSQRLDITNNAFSFPPNHPFLYQVMLQLVRDYNSNCWTCIGPSLFSKVVKDYLKSSTVSDIKIDSDVILVPQKRWTDE